MYYSKYIEKYEYTHTPYSYVMLFEYCLDFEVVLVK